jgi:hypothetical protein
MEVDDADIVFFFSPISFATLWSWDTKEWNVLQKGTRYHPYNSHKVYCDYDLPTNNTTPSTLALFATVLPRWPRLVPVLSVTSTIRTSSAPPRLRVVHLPYCTTHKPCLKLVISIVDERKIKHSVDRQNGRQTHQSHLSKMRLECRR